MSTEIPSERATALQWEQAIDLGRGLVTPGADSVGNADLSDRYGLPLDLRGQFIIDFHGRDGLFAAACLSRGATAVLALTPASRPTFSFVREALGYNATQMQEKVVPEVAEPLRFQGDIVLCLGIVNRSERPMEVLRTAVRTSRRLVVVECETLMDFEGASDEGTEKSWRKSAASWVPSCGAVIHALTSAGCKAAKVIWSTNGHAIFHGTK